MLKKLLYPDARKEQPGATTKHRADQFSKSSGWQLYCHPGIEDVFQGRQYNCHPNKYPILKK